MNGISVMPFVQSGLSMDYDRNSYVRNRIYLSKKSGLTCTGYPVHFADHYSANSRYAEQASPADRSGDSTCTAAAPSERTAAGRRAARSLSTGGKRVKAFLFRFLLLTFVIAGMTAGLQIMTRASSRQEEQSWKYYTTVTIPFGEDLNAIILTYRDSSAYPVVDDYVREICEINGLPYCAGEIPALSPGTKIVIPYYSSEKK